LAEGAVSWEEQQRAERERLARDNQAAASISIVTPGLDAAGRARACRELGSRAMTGEMFAELIRGFQKGLVADFALERARGWRRCVCGAPTDTAIVVTWDFRADVGTRVGAGNVALLAVGVVSWQAKVLEGYARVFHPACSSCGERRIMDRFERFFGEVPSVFRVGAVEYVSLFDQ
jgi:hypothetical protein